MPPPRLPRLIVLLEARSGRASAWIWREDATGALGASHADTIPQRARPIRAVLLGNGRVSVSLGAWSDPDLGGVIVGAVEAVDTSELAWGPSVSRAEPAGNSMACFASRSARPFVTSLVRAVQS